jgi:threonyl-tRNA synthetase
MGDVTLREFLSSRNLIPEYLSETDICIVATDNDADAYAEDLAKNLRSSGINVAYYGVAKDRGDAVKMTERNRIPFITFIGGDEVKSSEIALRHTFNKISESRFNAQEFSSIKDFIKQNR